MSEELPPQLIEARRLLDVDPAKARSLFQELIDSGVEVNNAALGFGVSLMKEKKFKEAAEALDCDKPSVEALINMIVCYDRLGDTEGSITTTKKLLATRQRRFEAPYRKLADWAMKKEELPTLYDALLMVFEIDSEDFGICMALADTCRKLKRHKQAVTFYLKALELNQEDAPRAAIYGGIAGLYKDTAQQDKAVEYYKRCYAEVLTIQAASNLIMCMQYAHGIDFKQFYNQCREYSARFLRYATRYQFSPSFLDPEKAKTGLRIGFSSGDFTGHSLANLLLEPFRRFKLIAPQHKYYLYNARPDMERERWATAYKATADVWRDVAKLDDEEMAELIHEDQIDVLVEIAGHTAYNRLNVFGHKPAPVQVGWVSGMMTPPAIETVNYFLTDEWIRPPCAEEVCFEKLYDLPAAYCYFPLANPPSVADLPADRNGYITFGSFNNPCKLSDEVLDVWCECLKRVPGSVVHIRVYSSATEKYIRGRYAAAGIQSSRVVFIPPQPRCEDVMAYYTNNIDIVLDTWPCAGCLTSAEAMWMGVPVVTYTGDTFLHRQTWTILNQTHLTELGADTTEGFVKAAVDLAQDRNRLRDIRKSLRTKMENAPIRDPLEMAKGVLASLEDSWVDWCRSRAELQEALA